MGAPFRIRTRITPEIRASSVEHRRAPRVLVVLATTLRALGLHGRVAVIRDLSATGFMAETDQEFLAGETARIQLPELGFVSARVVWTGGGRVAGEFDRALEARPLARLIRLGTETSQAAASEAAE